MDKNYKFSSINELIEKYKSLSHFENIEQVNILNTQMKHITQNEDLINTEIEMINKDNEKLEKGIFNWKKENIDLGKKSKIVSFFDSLENETLLEYFNPSLFQLLFPFKIIKNYLSKTDRNFGKKCYNETLTFQTKLLSCLIKFHIKYDFRKRPFINTKWINNINPFLRIKIRNIPIETEIYNKYGKIEGFIELINMLLKNFFPKVSKIWVDQGHFTHLLSIRLINLWFMYGIFSTKEAFDLLIYLNLKSDVLIKLEDTIQREFTKIPKEDFRNELIWTFIKLKKNFSSIIAQIFTLFNDEYLKSLYPFLKYNEKDKNYKKYLLKTKNHKGLPDLNKEKNSIFFINFELSLKSTQIILNYLGRELLFLKDFTGDKEQFKNNRISFKIYFKILIMFVSNSSNDSFMSSLKLINEDYMSYLLNDNFDYVKNINTEIEKLDIKVQQLKDNIVNNIYGSNYIKKFTFKKFLAEILLSLDYLIKNKDFEISFIKNRISETKIIDNLISIIYISTTLKTNDIVDDLITLAIFYLKEFNIDNYSNQSIIFKGNNLKYLIKLLEKKDIQIIIFMEGVFEYNNYFLFINKHIINYCLKQFIYLKDKMIEELKSNNGGLDNIIELIIPLIAFVKLFERFINIKKNINFKLDAIEDKPIDLIIQFVIYDLIVNLLYYINDNNLIILDKDLINSYEFNIKDKDCSTLIKLSKDKYYFKEETKKLLILEFFFSYLRLFNISCSRIYLEITYSSIVNNITYYINMLTTLVNYIKYIDYIEEIFINFNIFLIFSGNYLINDRTKINGGGDIFYEDHLKNIDLGTISNIIVIISNYIKDLKENEQNLIYIEDIKKFIKTAFLPLIYKYVNGLISLLLPKDEVEDFLRNIENIFKILNNNYSNIYFILKNVENEQYLKNKNLKQKINTTQDIHKHKELTKCRKICNQIIFMIEGFYNDIEKKKFLLEFKNSKSKINNGSQLKSSFVVKKKKKNYNKVIKKSLSRKSFNNNLQKYFLYIKNFYISKKIKYINNRDKNIFLKIINEESIHNKGSLNIFINYLFSIFNNNIDHLDIDFKNADLERFLRIYLINDDYITTLIVFNNIINICHEMRVEIYKNYCIENDEKLCYDKENNEIVEKMNKFKRKKITNSIKMIFQIYQELIYFCAYKIFKNNIWNQFFNLFQHTSDFFKNLMENNFVKFKLSFDQLIPQTSLSDKKTLFEMYHIYMSVLAKYSDVYINTENEIILSDREECFSTLIILLNGVSEFINGPCVENQNKVFEKDIDIWEKILLREIFNVDHEFYELKYSVLNYLSSLVEGRNSDALDLIGNTFNPNELFDQMIFLIKLLYIRQKLYEKKKKLKDGDNNLNNKITNNNPILNKNENKLISKCKLKDFKENEITDVEDLIHIYKTEIEIFSEHIIIQIVINIYKFFKDLAKDNNNYELFLEEKFELLEELNTKGKIKESENNFEKKNEKFNETEELIILDFINKITLVAEIRENDNTIANLIVFQKLPKCFLLTNETKDNFIENANITDTISKHNEIMDNYKIFDIESDFNLKIYKGNNSLFLFTSNDAFNYYQWSIWIISLIMNIWALVTFKYNVSTNSIYIDDSNLIAIKILNYTLIIFSSILIILWFLTKYELNYSKEQEKYNINKVIKKLNFIDKIKIYFINSILYNHQIMAFMLHFLFSVLSWTNERFFLALHIFLIIYLSKLMRYIIEAITINLDQLILTLFLAFMIIYTYSIFLLDDFSQDINKGYGKIVCRTLFECLVNSINYGLRYGGGISEENTMQPFFRNNQLNSSFFTKFLFDITFFFLINIIFLNIIQGIIVDTFATVRDAQRERINLIKNYCFLCGEKKENLEKYGYEFDDHNLVFHDVWKYFYLVIYLKNKNELTMTALEYKIYSEIVDKKTSWIPFNYINYGNDKKKLKDQKFENKLNKILKKIEEISKKKLKNNTEEKKLITESNMEEKKLITESNV